MSDGIEVYDGDGVAPPSVPIMPMKYNTSPTAAAVAAAMGQDDMHPLTTPLGLKVSFPFPQARPGQLEAIDRMVQIINRGEYPLLCAQTGHGKSSTLIGLASLFSAAWLVVGRNDLVEQWRSDFERYRMIGCMKSRAQFECPTMEGRLDKFGKPYTCSSGDEKCGRVMEWFGKWTEFEESRQQLGFHNDFVHHPLVLPTYERLEREEAQYERDLAAYKLDPDLPEPQKPNIFNRLAPLVQPWSEQVGCPYATNRDASIARPYTVMTVSMALTLSTYLPHMAKQRPLLVIDECSELESELIKFYAMERSSNSIHHLVGSKAAMGDVVYFDEKSANPSTRALSMGDPAEEVRYFVKRVKPPATVDGAAAWLMLMDELLAQKQRRSLDPDTKKELGGIRQSLAAALNGLSIGVPYTITILDAKEGDYSVILHPLEARGLFDRTLGTMGQHCVFSSATTGTAQLFRDTHAMARQVTYLEAGTAFPAAHRPILVQPAGNLSAKTFDAEIHHVVKAIVDIADRHDPDPHYDHHKQKGLIHTFTNKVTDAVITGLTEAGLGHRVVLLRGGGRDRAEAVNRFKASTDPLILVSPSAMLGLSLDGDKGRWQIVAKMPYANLGDPSVAHRKAAIEGWYSWQCTRDLIQSFGRIVRSDTDWGVSYVVDKGFLNHFRWSRDQFPAYVLDALHLP